MSLEMIKQLPISIGEGRKNDVRSQFAALCYRMKKDKIQVLLVTSRKTKRWIVPKGWPMDGKTPADSAAQEAWEEAGVIGTPKDICLGLFSYRKVLEEGDDDSLPCVAMVYPVKVKRMETKFPEAGQRARRWMSRKKAAQLVSEPELARILRDFDPKLLR